VLATRQVELARDAGALTVLPVALNSRIYMHLNAGELAAAASLIEEAEAVTEATGSHLAPYGALLLADWRGRATEATALSEASMNDVVRRGEGLGLTVIQWATAVLYNSSAATRTRWRQRGGPERSRTSSCSPSGRRSS
jgi:hypothetical protein